MAIRGAYFLVFSLFVFESLGSCASTHRGGGVHSRFRKGIQDDGKVVALTIQGATQRRFLQHRDQHDTPSSVLKSGGNTQSDTSSKHSGLEHETSKSFKLPHWAVYTLAISGAVLLVIIVTTSLYLVFTRRKKDHTVMPWSTGLSGPLRKAFVTGKLLISVPSLGRAELETACEDFINVIGTSSDCTWYKGTLSSGVEIAVVSTSVKSTEDWSDRSEDQFRNKISVLSRVYHKNFMNLLGYCTCDEPFTRMMVLSMLRVVPSLSICTVIREAEDLIFRKKREAEDLDWPTRLRIIMGVAYCLEHMSQRDPPVFPTNLSSSSIYLIEDYAAKISDNEFWKDDKNAATRNSSTDEPSIVYRFGILLREVISGRLPFSEDHGLLVLWASSYLAGKRPMAAMADPTLRSSVPDKDIAALCDVVRVCINREKEKRPAMAEVARMMRGVTALSPEQATPRDNPLWWAELEIASSETG
ncbi:hypothetical protein EJB05_29973 [Eragrostis curvula]|uniref:Tyrosine-protein kinase catalytic domain-containing protein n=1 Tax=Eragrostis curvula TaxID=38414 RepID=A0A5J9UVS9_9POAL|nr:hypothetical protein EJB05_29973 [Eragrostis curvula]